MNKQKWMIIAAVLLVVVLIGVGIVMRTDRQTPSGSQQTTGITGEDETTANVLDTTTTNPAQPQATGGTDTTEATVDQEENSSKPTLSASESLGTEGIPPEDDEEVSATVGKDEKPSGTVADKPDNSEPPATEPDNNETTSKPNNETTSKPNDETTAKPDDETTEPDDEQPTNTQPAGPQELTYAEYQALSGAEQLAYIQSFESYDAYFEWYNRVSGDSEDSPVIEITGPVDLEEIFGKQG